MDLIFLIAIVFSVLIFLLVINIIKGFFKIAFSVLLLFIILILFFGFIAYKDTKDILNGIKDKPNLYVLKDNKTIITTFSMKEINLSTAKSLTDKETNLLEKSFKNKDYKKLLEDYYKIIIIDKTAFPRTEDFNPDKIIESIKDENQLKFLEIFLNSFKKSKDNENNYESYEPKAVSFMILVSLSLKNDPFFLLKEYKKGNLEIYNENFSFKIIKFFLRNDNKTKKEMNEKNLTK
ncbi:MAG: hypothetical protein QXR96_02120 [Candidatus Woesearchaeota archaeon]